MVTEEEFERMARANAAKDGKPMVEKTIFIVKPIYVNAADYHRHQNGESIEPKKGQSKHKTRK